MKHADRIHRITLRFSLLALILCSASACQDRLQAQRDAFLLAEQHLAANNDAAFVAAAESLKGYPLYPYLRYQWLKDHLDKTDAVGAFLAEDKASPYPALLRGKWLDYLAKHKNWSAFLQFYQPNENSKDDCRWLWANYQTGNTELAFAEAKRLWLAGTTAPGCSELFSTWLKSEALTPELIWQRFETTLFQNKVDAAKAACGLLNGADRTRAENWLQLHDNPAQLDDGRFWPEKNAQAGRFFVDALIRLADSNPGKADVIWNKSQAKFILDDLQKNQVEQAIGMELLADKDARAFTQLAKVKQPDAAVRAAKLRAALLAPDWSQVLAAVSGLTETERQEPQARYWQARALEGSGQQAQAQTLFQQLAQDRSFYGLMAADRLALPYHINDQPISPDAENIEWLLEQPTFQACREFRHFNKGQEFRRQWQFAIKALDKDKLLAAAKLAQDWGYDQLAITTLVKAGNWDDLGIRFPVRYQAEIHAAARQNQLDPALVMGLIRQESMLDANATSAVGALGLMQMMPQTARLVASQLKQTWQDDKDLFKPDINIAFGTYYFNGLQSQFKRLTPAAIAAYNAGPGRVKKWLPLNGHVSADIWIDTIPYKETRKYVANVLTYTVIYQKRLNKTGLRLQDLLPDIGPV